MTQSASPRPERVTTITTVVVMVLLVYVVVAYAAAPAAWHHYEKRHPGLTGPDAPRITHTKSGIPGDPLNIALVGSEEEVHRGMLAAGWDPADPITLKSSLRIAADVVFRRPYVDAPVSDLFLFGRKQDLAFEKPIGHNPSKRHHVRFWKTPKLDEQGRTQWIGAATLDSHAGLSHTTGQITHHIAANVDSQRDLLLHDLQAAGRLARVEYIPDFQTELSGRNGGGDPWYTDGRLGVGILLALPSTSAAK